LGCVMSSNMRAGQQSRIAIVLILLVLFVFISRWNAAPQEDTHVGRVSQKKRDKIAIVTMTTSEKTYTHLSLKNKSVYARHNGYDLHVDFQTRQPKGPVWHKFTMIERLIEADEYEWIWWIDFDTLITNTTVKLENIISQALARTSKPDNIHALLTADCWPLNTGSMLFRSHPWSSNFLSTVWAYGAAYPKLSEQDAMRDVLQENVSKEQDHVIMVPQYKMNAFPDEIKCWDRAGRGWEYGTFLVHFAGAWAHLKHDDPTGYLMRKYEGQIIWPSDEIPATLKINA